MKRTISLVLTAFTVLSLWPVVLAQGLDLLTGQVGDRPICALTPTAATEIFGIPSRNHHETTRLVMEFSHHGLVLRFPNAAAEAHLKTATVFAAKRGGFTAYPGHFLGTVAKGTRSEPVRRLLRSARAEIANDEPDALHARLGGFDLEIGFVADLIDYATLTCVVGPTPPAGAT